MPDIYCKSHPEGHTNNMERNPPILPQDHDLSPMKNILLVSCHVKDIIRATLYLEIDELLKKKKYFAYLNFCRYSHKTT